MRTFPVKSATARPPASSLHRPPAAYSRLQPPTGVQKASNLQKLFSYHQKLFSYLQKLFSYIQPPAGLTSRPPAASPAGLQPPAGLQQASSLQPPQDSTTRESGEGAGHGHTTDWCNYPRPGYERNSYGQTKKITKKTSNVF